MEDFIKPQFVGQRPIDFEVLDDGKVVRKDRWQRCVKDIAKFFGPGEEIDLDELVVLAGRHLGGWLKIDEEPKPSVAFIWRYIDVMLKDGSILFNLHQNSTEEGYSGDRFVCERNGEVFDVNRFGTDIVAYRPAPDADDNLMPRESKHKQK
jgi:hypothetical protein